MAAADILDAVPSLRARSFLTCCALSVCLHLAVFGNFRPGPTAPALVPTPPVSGDTLDIQAPATPEIEPDSEEARASERPTSEPAIDVGGGVRVASAARTPAPSGGEDRHALFGAVGARFATDLSSTFTRAIPQAFSADPAWTEAPLGTAGAVDVTLVLDEAGHLETSSLAGHPSSALRSSIERTLALLAERSFTARQASTHLRVSTRVSLDDLHDGLHGDVFALSGGSFAGSVGTAFFALPARSGPGRRVDVQIHQLP
jgi:hypothetical protein